MLVSAILGGRARLVLRHPKVEELLTAEATLEEVLEYAAHLATRRRLSLDLVLMAAASLPVTVVEQAEYSDSIADAKQRIGQEYTCLIHSTVVRSGMSSTSWLELCLPPLIENLAFSRSHIFAACRVPLEGSVSSV